VLTELLYSVNIVCALFTDSLLSDVLFHVHSAICKQKQDLGLRVDCEVPSRGTSCPFTFDLKLAHSKPVCQQY